MPNVELTPSPRELAEKAQKLFPTLSFQDMDDQNFFANLVEEYGTSLDVMEQLKLFHAWCLDQHPTKIKNPRFRFRSWLANAAAYQAKKKQNNMPHLYAKKMKSE
jgi:hypothetical protein